MKHLVTATIVAGVLSAFVAVSAPDANAVALGYKPEPKMRGSLIVRYPHHRYIPMPVIAYRLWVMSNLGIKPLPR